jgi:serine/threonine-protein kinase
MTLVCVPAGEFQMGSTDADKSASPNEKPQHTVYLDAYWIDQTEVTSAMCAAFLNQKGNQTEAGSSWYYYTYGKMVQVNGIWKTTPGFDQHPETGMNWFGAKAYCAWAGRQLPSEAQWEKAARGTDNRLYPWGNQLPNNTLANYQEARGNTTAVKSYESGKNSYGLYDMAGNVSEWVEDWYGETYYQSQSTWRNPTGPVDGGVRIMRGGGYNSAAVELRSAFRGWSDPSWRDGTIGFRCVR